MRLLLIAFVTACAASPPPPAAPAPAAPAPAAPAPAAAPARGRIVVFPASTPRGPTPWGPAVPSPAAESSVQAVLDVLAVGGDVEAQLGELLVIAPTLWTVLARDPAVEPLGLPMFTRDPDTGAVTQGRAFAAPRPAGQRVADLLASGALRRLATELRGATVRAATDQERAAVYAVIPFEITGQPVTVVELGTRRLAICHDDEARRPWWIEQLAP